MIEGVKITNLKKIEDHRGSVLPMIRSDSKVFQSFGEIYFSTIFYNSIKAWHLHKKAVLNYACIKESLTLFLSLFVFLDSQGFIVEMYCFPTFCVLYGEVFPYRGILFDRARIRYVFLVVVGFDGF